MAVDAIAGTNGTQQILDDAGTGTYLGVAFTGVATLGKGAQVLGPRATALVGRAGVGANTLTLQAFVRGQSWLLSGSPWARLALAGGYGANSVDNATLWLLAALGDCDAVGEWTALQQLGALDGPLPSGDVLAAGGLLLPGRSGSVLSRLRALQNAGITRAERRLIIMQSQGLFDIDTIQPLPVGNNVALGPFTSGVIKPAGSDYIIMGKGSSQAEDYFLIQSHQLNARLLNEQKYGVIETVIPELDKADAILFFTKSGMVKNHYLTTQELRYVLGNERILRKTSFVTGFFP
jgi:hypothetical protein